MIAVDKEQNFFDEKIEQLIIRIMQNKSDFDKKGKLLNLNYQNTWINVNQKILKI